MTTRQSSEDYLERILTLSQTLPFVRSIDIVNDMGFSKPSVSIAMRKLERNKYIVIDDKGHISLTDEGRKIAETIYERHLLITKVLTNLGVPEDIARKDACKMEHDISEESFAAIKKRIK